MLTTAAVLMSLGTEPVSSHHAPPEQIDAACSSFAESFDEGIAHIGEVQMRIADDKTSQNTKDAKSLLTAEKLNVPAAAMTDAKANGVVRIQNELGGATPLVVGANSNRVGTVSGGTKVAAAMAGGLPQGERSKGSATAELQLDVPDDQLPVGSVPDAGQKLLPAVVEAPKTDVADGTVAPSTDVSAPAALLLPDNSQKPVSTDQKKTEIAEKALTTPTRKGANGQDDIGKTGKASKAEKTDKATGKARDANGIEAQMMITVPAVVASVDGQPDTMSASQTDVDLSRVGTIVTGQSAGFAAVAGKNNKASASVVRMDALSANSVVSSAGDDTASLTSGSDAARTTTQPTASVSGGNGKTQGEKVAVLASAPTRAESGIAGVAASGIGIGAAPVHIVSAKSQAADLSPSMVVTQAGIGRLVSPGTVDGGGPVDAAHKTLMASPTTLEVGVPNGTHGWLKIRAEMTGGGVVNASLSMASTSGQEMLHRELPSLTAYLQSERVAVNTVVIQPVATGATDFRGLAGGMNSDGQEQARQSGSHGGENRQDTAGTTLNRVASGKSYAGVDGIGGEDLLSPISYAGGGSWLSVRA